MRAHYLQHVPFEGLGSIEPWLVTHDYAITHTPLFESYDLPTQENIDFLIILGGPMSVNDEATYPWLIPEKAFIRAFLTSRKPILGICLGAQLIANVSGAKVYPNPEKEMGWFPIYPAAGTDLSCYPFPENLTAFHWHGETFDLPENANLLASSDACQNQAFQIGKNVIGLQFHLETTPAAARELATHCRNELTPGRYVQTQEQILSASPLDHETINTEMARLLQYLTQGTKRSHISTSKQTNHEPTIEGSE